MRNTVDILGVPVDRVTMDEAVEKVDNFLKEEGIHVIYTPNAEIMMAAYQDPSLKKILCEADMLIPDGAGVVLASKILGLHLPEKVPGFDLVKRMLGLRNGLKNENPFRCFLLGGRPGIAEAAAEKILNDYSGIEIAGCHHGYFSKEDEDRIISMINESRADMLLVALGAPKQERWIHEHKSGLKVKVCIGVGGALDVFAGKVKLAPEFFRKNYLEWLYRLYREPWRFKRMLALPRFMVCVVWARLSKIAG